MKIGEDECPNLGHDDQHYFRQHRLRTEVQISLVKSQVGRDPSQCPLPMGSSLQYRLLIMLKAFQVNS